MRTLTRTILTAFTLLTFLAAGSALAQPIAVGGETQVSTTSANDQGGPDIAMTPDGRAVITWYSSDQDGDREGVYAQRYDAGSNPVGGEFQVNTSTLRSQHSSKVDFDEDGNFVVVWREIGTFLTGTPRDGVIGQRFVDDGTPVGGEFVVSSGHRSSEPDVAVAPDGSFVVVWTEYIAPFQNPGHEVFGQLFDSASNPLGTRFQINTHTTQRQEAAEVEMDAAGNFVVVWQSFHPGGGNAAARRYSADGTPLSDEFIVNNLTDGIQYSPSVAVDPDGSFFVAWTDFEDSRRGIYGKSYAGDGSILADDFLIGAAAAGSRTRDPAVSGNGDGRFIVAWTDGDGGHSGDPSDIAAREVDASGALLGPAFGVNSTTVGDQNGPTAAMDSNGNFTVAWADTGDFDNGIPSADGDGSGVFSQRYRQPTTDDLIDELSAFIQSLGLGGGVENSLLSKLENVRAKLEQGNTGAAINQLGAFQNQVEAQAGKKISGSDAQLLLDMVDAILGSL